MSDDNECTGYGCWCKDDPRTSTFALSPVAAMRWSPGAPDGSKARLLSEVIALAQKEGIFVDGSSS